MPVLTYPCCHCTISPMSRLKSMSALFLAVSLSMMSLFPLPAPISAESDYKRRRLNAPTDGNAGGWGITKNAKLSKAWFMPTKLTLLCCYAILPTGEKTQWK
jgi:hypothetical protein